MPVTGYKAGNVERTTSPRQPAADLVAAYPRVAAVKTIVDKALADAAVVGNQPVGKVTADITDRVQPAHRPCVMTAAASPPSATWSRTPSWIA